MSDFEEALRNIDIFCRTLVGKMIEDDASPENGITLEPMEKLLLRKYVIEEQSESSPIAKNLIPLPQAEEPLIDVFEEDNYVKVLMQCRCREQKVSVHTDIDGIQVCKTECSTDEKGVETCADKCQKLDVPTQNLQVEAMTAKCSNNTVFEVDIPKKTQ
jgi:hypothetical protein